MNNSDPRSFTERYGGNVGGTSKHFYVKQGVYMTTLYEEMPRLTEKEIEERLKRSLNSRIRHALQCAREIEHLFIDMDNGEYDMRPYLTEMTGIRMTIEKVIDGWNGEKQESSAEDD